jgi:hypothetical protein
VPVSALRQLLEHGDRSQDGKRPPVRSRHVERQAEIMPSSFVEELSHVDPPPALLPHHWKDAEKKNETKETIPSFSEAASGTDKFSTLAPHLAFLAPLRILVHRVDLVAPAAIRDLRSFPDVEGPDQGPEERLASEIA